MSVHYLTANFAFDSEPEATDDQFEEFLDRVMDELLNLEEVDPGIIDPDMTASLAERTIAVNMGVEADTTGDAARLYLANVRTALHAAGCGTPDWPTFEPVTKRPEVRQLATAGA